MERITVRSVVAIATGAAISAAAVSGCAGGGGQAAGRDSADIAIEVADHTPAAAVVHHRTHTHRVVLVRGNGHTYSCASSVLPAVEAARARIRPRATRAYAMRSALRRIEKRYPSGTAPAATVTRYDALYKRYTAALHRTNRAISAYNRALRAKCDG